MVADIWRRSTFGRGVQRRRSGACNLAGADRNCVYRGWILLFDAPVAGLGNADAALGGDHPDGSGGRSHRIFPDARRKRIRLATGECTDHAFAGRADLVPLAVEFGVGNRDTGRSEPADDWIFAADVWSCSAETGKSRGGLANALTTTVLIQFSEYRVNKELRNQTIGDAAPSCGSNPPHMLVVDAFAFNFLVWEKFRPREH